jgi:hypothetical protein
LWASFSTALEDFDASPEIMNYLLALLISFLAGWSVAASEVLFKTDQRPGMFQGTAGMILLLALTGAGGLSAAGGILWAFRAVPSAAVMIVIAGGGWLGWTASNWLNVAVAGAVNRLLVGVAGLTVLYGLVWSFLPPP